MNEDPRAIEARVLPLVTRRLVSFAFICYVIAYIDRVNVGFVSTILQRELGLSNQAYGFGMGLFFIGYFLFEVPSNLILERVGARLWIARIMIVWGLVSMGTIFVTGERSFYLMRFLLGDAEELLRANPIDGVVLLGGCDKTVPGLLMGATSMNLPAIFLPAGPMLRGNYRGTVLGSGSDTWKYWMERRAGKLDECAWREMEDGIARSPGTCMTMGTASTMACAAEALGITLPGAASIPAVDSNHSRLASESGRRIVEMVFEYLKPRDVLSAQAFDNAIRVVMAIGGSTNAAIHLIAMAGRAGVPLSLARFDELSRTTPRLGNLRPSGEYLMEDFHYAAGCAG